MVQVTCFSLQGPKEGKVSLDLDIPPGGRDVEVEEADRDKVRAHQASQLDQR